MNKYTVWVCQSDGRGTTHVSSHEAPNEEIAAEMALNETTDDWGGWIGDLHVLGIAAGSVELIEWNDLHG